MDHTRASRRRFLEHVAAAAGGAAATRLLRAERAFASELDGLGDGRPGEDLPLGDRYLLDPDVLYLNHASVGTVPRVVHEARTEHAAVCESNPWLYMWGGAWDEAIEATRASVAALLGASADDVALTHNTTEGFNVLARGLPLGTGDEVLFSTLNHPGASICFDHAAPERGFTVRRFDLEPAEAAGMSADEIVEAHVAAIGSSTRLLVLPHVDNMVGVRHPLDRITTAAKDRGVRFVAADGAQTVGMLSLDLPASGIDFYAGSPHKWVQAPKGLGLLYVRPGARESLRPLQVTWGQDRWAGTIRVYEDYGTRNLPEVLALGDAADFQAALGARRKEVRYREMRQRLRDGVAASPRLEWLSPEAWDGGASLVAVGLPGRDAPALGAALWRHHGVVVRAFGGELNALRVSPNLATTDAELDRFLSLLEESTP